MMENSSDSKALKNVISDSFSIFELVLRPAFIQTFIIILKCCIDFINENDDETIETVSFNADNLQLSAKAKAWQPGTDSFCRIEIYNEELGRYEIDSESY